jgi:uncharacterized membrane protein
MPVLPNPYAPPAGPVATIPFSDLQPEQQWEPAEVISLAWQRFKENGGVLVASLVLGYLISLFLANVVSMGLTGHTTFNLKPTDEDVGWAKWGLVMAVTQVTGSLFGAGMFTVALAAARQQSPSVGLLFNGMGRFVHYFLSALVWGLATGVGFVFLIVPGVIVGLGLSQMILFAVDRGMWPMEAARASWTATNGEKAKLFILWVLLSLVMLAGFLACFVGVLAAFPVTFVAAAIAYDRQAARLPVTATAMSDPAIAPL